MDFPAFAFGMGEEASDPIVTHDRADVRFDQLVASGHIERIDDDLADVARVGVDVWRYGMPWRLTEPERGVYDWTWWDRALAACDRAGLQPVVDLCHFGLPDHYPGFADGEWVDGFIRFTEAFLDRYREPTLFTPVNEPVVTALMSGLLGVWNDRLASTTDYAVVLANCALANLEAMARIRSDRGGWFIGAEAFICPVTDPDRGGEGAEFLRDLWWASYDLQFGVPLPETVRPVFGAVDDDVMARIGRLATKEHSISGHDFYPTSVTIGGERVHGWTVEALVDVYLAFATEWFARYGVDFWVAETSNLGLPPEQQSAWLDALLAGLAALEERGLPVRGICWYSRGDQVDWDTNLSVPAGAVTHVGMFDQQRRPRAVTATWRHARSARSLVNLAD